MWDWLTDGFNSFTNSVSNTYDSMANYASNTWDNYSSTNSYACAQVGDFGVVAGGCVDTNKDLYAFAGVGTPGVSGTYGTVVNGTTNDYLSGWGGGAGNVLGAGTTGDGTTALTFSTPGASASLTYGINVSQGVTNWATDMYNQGSNWVYQTYGYGY